MVLLRQKILTPSPSASGMVRMSENNIAASRSNLEWVKATSMQVRIFTQVQKEPALDLTFWYSGRYLPA